MRADSLIALLVFLFPLAYSPGPGNAFFAALGASKGLRAALPALAGYHVATLGVTALIGLGMGVTVLEHPAVATALSAAGSLYVLWLAWSFLKSARAETTPATGSSPVRQRAGVRSGAVVLLLNPKAYYIIAVMFAQFPRPASDRGTFSVLVITAIFTLNNLVAFIIWATGGSALMSVFRSDQAKRRIDYLFAAALVGVAAWMAIPLFS